MSMLRFSFILFICYSPITVILRNAANIAINNNSEVWKMKNNQKMMSILKYKNKFLYWLMQIEILVFTILIICVISKIFRLVLTMLT